MSTKDEILAELDGLIVEGKRIDASYYVGDMGSRYSKLPEVDFHSFATASRAAIARIAGLSSEFYRVLPATPPQVDVLGYGGSFISGITGALAALQNAVRGGLLVTLENQLRANVYDDFLVQAEELLKANYHVAAMVLVGGVLEDHLRKLCDARKLKWSGNGSISKYNDLLRDTIYPQPTWRRIQGVGDLRNDAAHGQGTSIKVDDVKDSLQFARRFLADYPA